MGKYVMREKNMGYADSFTTKKKKFGDLGAGEMIKSIKPHF